MKSKRTNPPKPADNPQSDSAAIDKDPLVRIPPNDGPLEEGPGNDKTAGISGFVDMTHLRDGIGIVIIGARRPRKRPDSEERVRPGDEESRH